ncbi:M81 family metallopeptidase [Trueperella pecoris]|uniref:M81 family metallopeptidase n=1 Tax=Trueperella pecoris TaxID=2733571 RepID=A0A7M1R0N4_9ACTO|nr:M81 family metallopeptidase [Trueperella pecoris]QOR47830.1 M81 family metallopeptidase [Trueperella pecoris]
MSPRIAIAGIHIESSTFSPQLAVAGDFEVTRGEALMRRYSWINETWSQAVTWLPVFHARALPGGVLERDTYEEWKAEIIAGLAALTDEATLDGFFFDVHGAMSVVGLDDAEGDLITAIRAVIGEEVLVSLSTDLHGNMSRELFSGCDLLTTYREAPHTDALESRRRAMKNLVMRLLGGQGKPAKALVHMPFLLPGERTSTRLEPAKSLYGRLPWLEAQPGILDVAFWIGFAWADQPRCKAAVVATGDDAELVTKVASDYAREIWARHAEFEFVAPVDSMDGCLEWARDAARPTFISDTGDNPGAGGADDVTYALARLLAFEPVARGQMSAIYASIHDADTVARALAAGVGGEVDIELGGKIDSREPGPLPLRVRVENLAVDPRAGQLAVLRPLGVAGTDGVVEGGASAEVGATTASGAVIIVTQNRMQYGTEEAFTIAGVDPRAADIVVVKIGYLEPDLYEMAADWKMALTPGGVDQDLVRLGHQTITRPMYPFDEDFAWEPEVITC